MFDVEMSIHKLGGYTKEDVVTMLTDIQLEIEELENPLDYDFEGYNQCAVDCEKIIQQKIDKLKEAHNDREKDI